MQIKENIKVEVITKNNETFTGILLPSHEKGVITLKLTSGYNIILPEEEIKEIKEVGKQQEEKLVREEIKIQEGKPTITILHLGGTIASRVDYATGAVKALFKPEEILEMFPELLEIANINSRFVANILSENIRFNHYNLIAEEIKKEINKGVDGIIITHGTDTMHYTAAALSFMLQALPIPVLLVGAQRSSDRGSSDAFLNLVSAAYFIAETDFAEVAICMHASTNDNFCYILQGNKARKMHTSRRDAFKPINCMPYAEVDFYNKRIKFLRNDYTKKDKSRKLQLKKFNENIKVGIIKARPNIFASELLAYEDFHGLIIEGTGLGHLAVESIDKESKENEKILEAIKKLASKMPVVMTSQCLYGTINMNVYSTGRILQQAGVIGNFLDLTPETAYIKLAWLLSNYKNKEKVKELMMQNIAKEISNRSVFQDIEMKE